MTGSHVASGELLQPRASYLAPLLTGSHFYAENIRTSSILNQSFTDDYDELIPSTHSGLQPVPTQAGKSHTLEELQLPCLKAEREAKDLEVQGASMEENGYSHP